MSDWRNDSFEVLVLERDASTQSARGTNAEAPDGPVSAIPGVETARLHGFDLNDQPLLVGLPALPYEVVTARTLVSLASTDIGRDVAVLFDKRDLRRPIVVGVLQASATPPPARAECAVPVVAATIDEHRVVISAEREIVLRCGDASITLTRAGKVLIDGAYVLSRSSGHNRIKGAIVDIN